jgi:hypothetical protein
MAGVLDAPFPLYHLLTTFTTIPRDQIRTCVIPRKTLRTWRDWRKVLSGKRKWSLGN